MIKRKNKEIYLRRNEDGYGINHGSKYKGEASVPADSRRVHSVKHNATSQHRRHAEQRRQREHRSC